MNEIQVGEKTQKYIGEPLKAYVLDGSGWCGRSNLLDHTHEKKTDIQLINLDDCFKWMKKYSCLDYVCGYVLDYKKKTIYYDKEGALDHLLQKVFPKQKTENYFLHFIKKDFKV